MRDSEINEENPGSERNGQRSNDLLIRARGLPKKVKEAIEFFGKHPLVTGVLALFGIAGLVLSIVGYQKDRSDAQDTTDQIYGVEQKLDVIYKSTDIEHEEFSPNYKDIKYINMLPGINDTAYFRGHQAWDTGITSRMIDGNFVVQEIYLDIAVQLARKYYPPRYFGKDPEKYFTNKVNQELAAYRSLSATLGAGFGSIETLTASQEGYKYLEKKIEEMVMHVSNKNPSLNFREWEAEWEKAKN